MGSAFRLVNAEIKAAAIDVQLDRSHRSLTRRL